MDSKTDSSSNITHNGKSLDGCSMTGNHSTNEVTLCWVNSLSFSIFICRERKTSMGIQVYSGVSSCVISMTKISSRLLVGLMTRTKPSWIRLTWNKNKSTRTKWSIRSMYILGRGICPPPHGSDCKVFRWRRHNIGCNQYGLRYFR